MATDDLLGPLELEQTGAAVETSEFQTQLVVLVHGTPFIAAIHIAFSPTTAAPSYAAPTLVAAPGPVKISRQECRMGERRSLSLRANIPIGE